MARHLKDPRLIAYRETCRLSEEVHQIWDFVWDFHRKPHLIPILKAPKGYEETFREVTQMIWDKYKNETPPNR